LDADNIDDALAIIAREPVEVILTDLYMPGKQGDGINLILQIRRRPPPHPVIIAMSGEPHRAYRSSLQSARYLGADFTLTKPILSRDLIQTIRSATGVNGALPLPTYPRDQRTDSRTVAAEPRTTQGRRFSTD
jgi:CheY-like chemotaxis protein